MIEEKVIEKLLKWANGERTAPHKVHLYPTNRCNLRCQFCYQQLSPYDYSDVMSKDKWLEITRELCEMGVDVIRISGGGEPLLVSEKTLPMMEETKKHEVRGRMTTNGTLFDEKSVSKIVNMGWDNMVFSIDGPDAKTHDFHRGRKGAFRKAVENLERFKRIKKEEGKEKPLIEFSTVLSKRNWRKVPEIIDLADEKDVDVITFEPLFVSNPKVKELKMDENDRKKFLEHSKQWKEKAESLGIFTNIDTVIDIGEVEKTGDLKEEIIERSEKGEEGKNHEFLNLPCYEPWLWPKIEANGDVGPCSTNLLDSNIKNKSFKEIWYGEEFEEFRELIKNKNLPSGCSNCVSTHIPLNQEIRKKLREKL